MSGAVVGSITALVVTLLVTPWLARGLRAAGLGQQIQDEVTHHIAKAGTPTMGGLMISLGLVVGYLAAHVVLGTPPTGTGLLVILTVLGGAVIGATDDWLKGWRARNLGLRERQKTAMQVALIIGFGVVYLRGDDACTHISLFRCATVPLDVGPVGWFLFAAVVFWTTSNAVNFTDGIEGLLAGSAVPTFAALGLIALWQFRHPADYEVRDALDLAIICGALGMSCLGFLWWNGSPKTVFMGDTGSLAIGAAVAALALTMHVAMLVPVLGALYVAEGASSYLQRFWFRRTGGKRLFKMAPLHHHFEIHGWSEPTIIVRFWILSSVAAAIALAMFYVDAVGYAGA